jgi:DNA-binding response OmpR family regulator
MARQCRILVIGDDPHLGRTLTLMLEHAGYAVTPAPEDLAALGGVSLVEYDLILLDIMMLAPGGLGRLRWLRQNSGSVPILVLVGDYSSSLDADLRQQGATTILYKPVSPESLLAQVTELLQARTPPET